MQVLDFEGIGSSGSSDCAVAKPLILQADWASGAYLSTKLSTSWIRQIDLFQINHLHNFPGSRLNIAR